MINLSKRLALCSSFVRQGANVADIGTDHAYLPIYLVLSGKANYVTAADINNGPLEHGRENINKYKLSDRIEILLSNGLEKINENKVNDIIIAGMGGELIINIIDSCKWLKNREKHLILQPMTKPELLREYLCKNGFEIINEKAVFSEGKIYSVMLACFSGEAFIPDEKMMYFGKLDFKNDEFADIYKNHIINKLERQYSGLTKGNNPGKIIELENLLNKLKSG